VSSADRPDIATTPCSKTRQVVVASKVSFAFCSTSSRDDLTDAMVAALLTDPEPDVVKTARWSLARRALAG
jgi:hypothetical protein